MSRPIFLSLGLALALTTLPAWPQDASTPPARSIPAATVRARLESMVPPGVVIEALRDEAGRFVFTGHSSSNQLLSDFMRKADSTPGFTGIELRTIESDGSRYRYEMSIQVDCAAAGATRPGALCASVAAKSGSVHKCRINGTLTFQSAPCPPGSEG